MRKGTPLLRWLIVAAVTLCWFTGLAAAADLSYRTKNMEAWNYLDQAAAERAKTDPIFNKALTEIQNQTKAMSAAKPQTVKPAAKVAPAAPPALPYPFYPYPQNVAPPWFNPGLGFNAAVNYDLPNYNMSPNLQKFVNKLPGLGKAGCTVSAVPGTGTCNENELGQYIPIAVPNTTAYPDADYYEISASAYSTKMHRDLPATSLWGYKQTNATDPKIQNVNQYLGPFIVARVFDPTKPPQCSGLACQGQNGKPIRVKFTNALPLSNTPGGKLGLPVDPTLMGAGMGPTAGVNYTENRVTIPHLHGGRTPWISDGTPHQWITPAGDPIGTSGGATYTKGVSLVNVPDMPVPPAGSATMYWTNQQSPRLMFYHDHAFGTTRLTVYKGVASGYLLVDQVEDDLIDGTNVSGLFSLPGAPAQKQILPNIGVLGAPYDVYRYGIPLVIQDKSFVNDATTPPSPGYPVCAPNTVCAPGTYPATSKTAEVDPLWVTYYNTPGGQLHMSHEYMPVENIFDTVGGTYPDGSVWPAGNMTNGRWDYGPFLIPPMVPTVSLILPSPTITPEAFGDTMVVNGAVFPYVNLPADTLRFRILSVGNDRTLNLQWYFAKDKNGVICKSGNAFDAASCTEVSMVPAAPNATYPTWPKDGRDGGVPDPTTQGPQWYLIGNEGGFLAQVSERPSQPIDYNYIRQIIPLAGVTSHSLLMLPAMRADVVVDFTGLSVGDVLILYNDAPAPMPGFWPLNDYFTDCPDQRGWGGPGPIAPGYGPNTRTVMQVRIALGKVTPFAFDPVALKAAIPKAFAKNQDPPIVPQLAYNAAFPGIAARDIYMQAPDNTLNLTGTGQGIARIKTVMGGNGYTTAPTVNIIGDGTGAKGTAGLNPMGAVTLLTTGAGYTSAPTVALGAPGAGGVQATAIATISGGQVQAISIDEPGSNYSTVTAPTCTITGGGATTAATCSTMIATAGLVGSITVTAPGSGYTREPRVYLLGGGGMNASADALLKGAVVMTAKNITEGFDPEYGRLDIKLGSTPNPLTPSVGAGFVLGIARYIDPPTEIVNNGEATAWRITHLGVDSHALHFHLFDVQVVNRVDWTNVVKPPYEDELGWRDTIRTNPMEDIAVVFRPYQAWLPFQLPRSKRLLDPTTPLGSTASFYPVPPPLGVAAVAQQSNVMTDFGFEYVWHCHMLSHEENDFMRPMVLNVPPPVKPVLTFAVTPQVPGAPAVNLTWAPASGTGTTYTCQRSTSTTFTGASLVSWKTVDVLTYYDPTITPGARYYYRVQAKNQGGTSAWSNVVNVMAIISPSNLAVGTPTRTSIPLTWVQSSTTGVTGFSIQRARNATFTSGLLTTNATPGTLTSRTMTGLTTNTTYYFRIAARTATGTSGWSNVVTAKTLP